MIQEKIDKLKEEIKRLKDTMCNGQLHFNEVTRRFQIAEATLKAHEEDKAEFLDILDKLGNPYPTDIFPEITAKSFEEIQKVLNEKFLGFPFDRISANLMRRARDTLKEEIKQSLIGKDNGN